MLCPICKVELKIADRQGVEIDYCPQCRGVWLDRGELDKLLERAAPLAGPAASGRSEGRAYEPGYQPPYRPPARDRDYDDDDYDRRSRYGKRRRGWLDDIFDFD